MQYSPAFNRLYVLTLEMKDLRTKVKYRRVATYLSLMQWLNRYQDSKEAALRDLEMITENEWIKVRDTMFTYTERSQVSRKRKASRVEWVRDLDMLWSMSNP